MPSSLLTEYATNNNFMAGSAYDPLVRGGPDGQTRKTRLYGVNVGPLEVAILAHLSTTGQECRFNGILSSSAYT